ncbi:MAG: hypothetical protein AAF221_05690 [Pseudomonadota bacterium]
MEWTNLQRGARKLLQGADEGTPVDTQNLPVAGDKYFESRPPHHVWIVSKVYQPPSSKLPHVLLDRCGKFPASKLLSTEALTSTQFFRRDRRDSFDQDRDVKQKRRHNDPLQSN